MPWVSLAFWSFRNRLGEFFLLIVWHCVIECENQRFSISLDLNTRMVSYGGLSVDVALEMLAETLRIRRMLW
jgi:hypothetical protein